MSSASTAHLYNSILYPDEDAWSSTDDDDTGSAVQHAHDQNEVEPSPLLYVTTVTSHLTIPSTGNVLSISHYLEHYQHLWPEIYKIRCNFGRQIAPDTKRRIFYNATWFRLHSNVERPHNLCIRFNNNGSIHVTGVINPAIERPWLEEWLKKFFKDIHTRDVPCIKSITQRSNCNNLWACSDGFIWSPTLKVPIGWSPKIKGDDACGDELTLFGKPVREIEPDSAPKHLATSITPKFRSTKGSPIRYFDEMGHLLPLLSTKKASHWMPTLPDITKSPCSDDDSEQNRCKAPNAKRQRCMDVVRPDHQAKTPDDYVSNAADVPFTTSMATVYPFETKHPITVAKDALDFDQLIFDWTTDCINAKCSTCTIPDENKPRKNKHWLDRDVFKTFMQTSYPSLMVSFDPDIHKAAQVTVFSTERNTHGRFEQRGSVQVTRTGLFWLYGFQQMKFANEIAEMMKNVIEIFRRQQQLQQEQAAARATALLAAAATTAREPLKRLL